MRSLIRPFSHVASLIACATLAACEKAPEPPANMLAPPGFEPPTPVAPSPIAGQAQTVPLTAYIGHDARDPIGGVGFFDRTAVATALNDAVGDADLRRRIVRDTGRDRPIFAVGRRIASRGCAPKGCDADSWTLLIDPVTGKGELCRHLLGDPVDTGRWYAGDRPMPRRGACPMPPAADPV